MSDVKDEVERQLKILLRGVVDCVQEDELRRRLEVSIREKRPLRVKLGLDPTAPDIHLGHTVVLRKLRQFQDFGHEAILLIGGATAMLGDPTGKDKTRPQLSREQVDANAKSYLDQARKVLAPSPLTVVNNAEWFLEFRYADMLRLCARTTVARMIERDLFARRLQQGNPIGIHEFLYPLLQGWDSVELRCDVELGGTDQLFNLLLGRELQGQEDQKPQLCLTTPLLLGLDGTEKMSKSLGNYIGLDFTPEDIYGKVMSIPDPMMRDWFILLTSTEQERVDELLQLHPREAKAELARQVTAWLHGDEGASAGAAHFDRLFRDKQVPDDIPSFAVPAEELEDGRIWVVRLLVLVGFAKSGGEARRLVKGRGVKLDGSVVDDVDHKVDVSDAEVLVQAGKRRFVKVSSAG